MNIFSRVRRVKSGWHVKASKILEYALSLCLRSYDKTYGRIFVYITIIIFVLFRIANVSCSYDGVA